MATRWVVVLLAGWLGGLAVGFTLLARWETTPGEAVAAPPTWPLTATIGRSLEHPTIVMFAHPRCSCTRASLAELANIMRDGRHAATAIVVFFAPDGSDPAWLDTPTWEVAGEVERVTRVVDRGGHLARLFGAKTSGHVVVYGRDGRLAFSGGITGSRGHPGDNVGRRSALAALIAQPNERSHAVFGCALGGS